MANKTMMEQYAECKAASPAGAIILFRVGDFYEAFEEDAKTIAGVLGLVLGSSRVAGARQMCGFPYHQLEPYVRKLLASGLKIAIGEYKATKP